MTENEQKLEIVAAAAAEFLAVLSRAQGDLLAGLADRPKAGRKKAARDALVIQMKAARELRNTISLIRGSQVLGSSPVAHVHDEQAGPYSRVLASIQRVSELPDGWADGHGLGIDPSSVTDSINALRHMTGVCAAIDVVPGDDGSVCFMLQHGNTAFVLSFVGEGKVDVSGTTDDGAQVGPYPVGIESKKFRKLWS